MGRIIKSVCIAGFMLAAVAFSACAEVNERELTLGTRADGVYSNEYFGFSVSYPEGFSVVNSADIASMLNLRVYRLSDTDTLVQLRMLPLLFANYYPEHGAASTRSVTMSAERTEGFRNETEYLQSLLLPWSESTVVHYEDVTTATVNFAGRNFHSMTKRAELETTDGERIITGYHIYYVTRMYGYFVMFAFADSQNPLEHMQRWVGEVMGSFAVLP